MGSKARICKYGIETVDFLKGGEFLDQQTYWPLDIEGSLTTAFSVS
jgi:hypothetical protein